MKKTNIPSWHANILSTLDDNYVTIKIDKEKAKFLVLQNVK